MLNENCTLSIIIPTYNRAHILKKCLHAIEKQEKIDNHGLEIIVVDDGSTDDTEEVTRTFSRNSKWAVQYLKQTNQGANAARNKGIRLAKGRLLLFINDDILPTPKMVYDHLTTHQHYPEQNIGVLGRVCISSDIPYSPISKLHLDAGFDRLDDKEWLDWTAFFTCNVSVKTYFFA